MQMESSFKNQKLKGVFIIQNKQIENAVNEVKKKYLGKRDRYDMGGSEWKELARMAATNSLKQR